jgi:hypothetical protein
MMETAKHVRVFVSHSSLDKERFVLPFAESLLARGIDAWLDKWEMLPGDSLVDKIFEEGLKEAAAFVIVLSHNSVRSEWVRKELNTATVHRIEKGTQLIPVVLDDCEIPECLKDTVYERVRDPAAYQAEFDRIVAAIEQRTLKPPLGTPPVYVSMSLPRVPGLEQQDVAILKELGDFVLRRNDEVYEIVQDSDLTQIVGRLQLTNDQLQESLTILEELKFTRPSETLSPEIPWVQLSQFGFRTYLDSFYPSFESEMKEMFLAIVNQSLTGDAAIAEQAQCPVVIVRFLLKELESRSFLRLAEWNTGCEILSLSPSLKRALRNGERIV